ncbi:MAG: hypothetical protein WC480_01310 [Patescibacteria group bacterium]
MKFNPPKNSDRFVWTAHAKDKMRYYQLSVSRVLRVFNYPKRIEEGIAPKTTAVMQPATYKHTSEIWLMYQLDDKKRVKIITAWRYPAKSPVGKQIPIPEEIKKELKILN